ncbi:hypothetical protein GA0115241_101745 [Streptomyces sp. DpondAA-D4]|nr:hypothetical protein GA0115241_101745 [Streptomyces sp. DpondAA-D4]
MVTLSRCRDVNRMLSDAGIRPRVTQVCSDQETLTCISGAKRPLVQD